MLQVGKPDPFNHAMIPVRSGLDVVPKRGNSSSQLRSADQQADAAGSQSWMK